MRPRRTHYSDVVFRLEGATEDNDLWAERAVDEDGMHVLLSTWQPTDQERAAIAAGANVELALWSVGHPPVSVVVTDKPLGAPPRPLRAIDAEGEST